MVKRDLITGQSARLKKIRLYLGMTREQFSDAIGISQFTIRSWEVGAKNFTKDGVQRVVNLLGTRLNFIANVEWLMFGTGSSPISLHEDTEFKSYNEVKIDSSYEKLLKEISTFKSLHENAKIILVSDDAFKPIADVGDYIGFIPVKMRKASKLLGKFILLELNDDECIFGLVQKKRALMGLLNLSSNKLFPIKKIPPKNIFQLVWLRKIIS